MKEFDFLFSTEGLAPLSKLPSTPDLPFDDFFWQTRKTPVSNTVAKRVMSDALQSDLLGEFGATPLLGFEKEQREVQTLSKVLGKAEEQPSWSWQAMDYVVPAPTLQDRLITSQLEAGGVFGKRLQKAMQKNAYTLSEAMSKMVANFAEFFTPEDQRLLEKQIAALDLAGFFQMFDKKVLSVRM
jgi:hypothetical protein